MIDEFFAVIGTMVCIIGGCSLSAWMLAQLIELACIAWKGVSNSFRGILKAESLIYEYKNNRDEFIKWKKESDGKDMNVPGKKESYKPYPDGRLTIRNSDGTVSQPTSTTIEAMFCKLAAYEDIGLDPEEVTELLAEQKKATSVAIPFDYRSSAKCPKCGIQGRIVGGAGGNGISFSAYECRRCGKMWRVGGEYF